MGFFFIYTCQTADMCAIKTLATHAYVICLGHISLIRQTFKKLQRVNVSSPIVYKSTKLSELVTVN